MPGEMWRTSQFFGGCTEIAEPAAKKTVQMNSGVKLMGSTSLLNAESGVIDKLNWLRDAGIQVAIDDFGTGYSSLSYLELFDIDYLKIDKSFVNNLASNANDVILCDAIILMAHTLGLKVIAEGVETVAQKKLLTDAACDFAQGYLFSRPVPADEFEDILNTETEECKYAWGSTRGVSTPSLVKHISIDNLRCRQASLTWLPRARHLFLERKAMDEVDMTGGLVGKTCFNPRRFVVPSRLSRAAAAGAGNPPQAGVLHSRNPGRSDSRSRRESGTGPRSPPLRR